MKSKHDQEVERIARELENDGWDVEADLPGWDQPEGIGKDERIPDIVAKKKGAERIIEVETESTLKKDKLQQQIFRRRAAQKKRATFRIKKV